MKKQSHCHQHILKFLLLIVGLLVACQPNSLNPAETASAQATTQKVTIAAPPSEISTATQPPVPTLMPTVLPIETVTSIPTVPTLEPQKSTATQVNISTQPTLEPQDAANILFNLLQNNEGCLLPCWWGATPGQTKWSEVNTLMKRLDGQYYEPRNYLMYHLNYSFKTH